jgi:2-hydroxy-3-keto-5-methylthiopentenyl-1-phosphate phosphatase
MSNIPQKVHERLVAGIKKFKPVLIAAQKNNDNESNTVTIITDMLSEIFGFAKYSEITSEIAIRGNFCDLATQIEKKIQSLIEAKAISHKLNDAHILQAVSYAENNGVDWVVLTNGINWYVYKVIFFTKPIDHEKIIEIDFLNIDHHNPDDLESLFRLTKEGWIKSALNDYYEQRQALSKYSIAAILSTDSVLSVIRRNLKLISPDARINAEQIRSVLEQEVIDKDFLTDEREKEKLDEARKKIAKALKKAGKESVDENSPLPIEPVQNLSPEVCPPNAATTSVSPPPN